MTRISHLLMLAFLSAFAANAHADFASYVAQYDFTALYPARPNFGSGTVFRIERSPDGSRYTRVICRNLFARRDFVRTAVGLKSVEYDDAERFGEAMGVIYGLLTSSRQSEENLIAQKVTAVKLSYDDAVIERLPATIQPVEAGTPIELDSTCLAALTKLEHEGKDDRIYVVDRALFVNRFTIRVERPSNSTVELAEMLGISPEHEYRSIGMHGVEVTAPYYLGMNALLISEIGPVKPGTRAETRIVKTKSAKLPLFRAWQ